MQAASPLERRVTTYQYNAVTTQEIEIFLSFAQISTFAWLNNLEGS